MSCAVKVRRDVIRYGTFTNFVFGGRFTQCFTRAIIVIYVSCCCEFPSAIIGGLFVSNIVFLVIPRRHFRVCRYAEGFFMDYFFEVGCL